MPTKLNNPAFNVEAHCDKLAASGSEHGHQRAFFAWVNWAVNEGLWPLGRLAFAVPNGGKRDPITAARLKAEGVKPGVPDIVVPLVVGEKHGLYIELKVKDNKASDAQDKFHADLRGQGYSVVTCWGWRAARAAFVDYSSARPMPFEYHAQPPHA